MFGTYILLALKPMGACIDPFKVKVPFGPVNVPLVYPTVFIVVTQFIQAGDDSGRVFDPASMAIVPLVVSSAFICPDQFEKKV